MRRKLNLQAGNFDKRVIWQREIETPDGCGGFTKEWMSQGAIWINIIPLSASQREYAGTFKQSVSHVVWLRAWSDLKRGDHFVFGSRRLQIEAVIDPDETGRYMKCDVKEVS